MLDAPKVAAVQMTSTADVESNLRAAERLVRQAAAQGAVLAVLPEGFAYLGPEAGKTALAEPLPADGPMGPILGRLVELARDTGLELVLGGFWERAPDGVRVRNTSVHLGPDGAVRAAYRKVHLFDVTLRDGTRFAESETVEAGDALVTSASACGVLGHSICYDVRFPELYRGLVDRGATVLLVPAAFTEATGREHWHLLVRARAVESQAFVVAAAQVGVHYGTRASYGHAMVVDPWGRVLSEVEAGEGVAVAAVDPRELERVRATFPSLANRRL